MKISNGRPLKVMTGIGLALGAVAAVASTDITGAFLFPAGSDCSWSSPETAQTLGGRIQFLADLRLFRMQSLHTNESYQLAVTEPSTYTIWKSRKATGAAGMGSRGTHRQLAGVDLSVDGDKHALRISNHQNPARIHLRSSTCGGDKIVEITPLGEIVLR